MEHVRSQRAQNESTRARDRSAKLAVRLLQAAGDKYVPDATLKLQQDRQKSAIEALRENGVVTPKANLYEEFVVWRTKQLMFQ